jgi:hypothetical protein
MGVSDQLFALATFFIGKASTMKSITFIKTFFVKILILWEVMPCAMVYSYWHFREQEAMKLLWHSNTCLPDSTALHPSKL